MFNIINNTLVIAPEEVGHLRSLPTNGKSFIRIRPDQLAEDRPKVQGPDTALVIGLGVMTTGHFITQTSALWSPQAVSEADKDVIIPASRANVWWYSGTFEQAIYELESGHTLTLQPLY